MFAMMSCRAPGVLFAACLSMTAVMSPEIGKKRILTPVLRENTRSCQCNMRFAFSIHRYFYL